MVEPWLHRAFTFRALSKTYGQMWLRCDVCRRYRRQFNPNKLCRLPRKAWAPAYKVTGKYNRAPLPIAA